MNSLLVAISPFSSFKNSYHTLLDDEFYFSFLLNQNEPFVFYTSQASAARILKIYPEAKKHLKVIEGYKPKGLGHFIYSLKLKVPANSKVMFFGYTERLILAWYMLNIFKPLSLILVATNNFSLHRVIKYAWQLRFFFWVIGPKLRRLILHTDYELSLVNTNSKSITGRCYVKKHHLMIPRIEKYNRSITLPLVISYFGPHKPEKPLRPMLDLIEADKRKEYVFKLYNVSISDFLEQSNLMDLPTNVIIHNFAMTDETYDAEFSTSDIIMMTHEKAFEGKLSGNLCDCIAHGIPYIAPVIEPFVSLQLRYGVIGYLKEFQYTRWAEKLLSELDVDKVTEMSINIRKAGSDFTLSKVNSDLESALKFDNDF